MTTCVGFGTTLFLVFVTAVLPFCVLPALAAWWAARRSEASRFLPAVVFAFAGLTTALEATLLDRPWMPAVYFVTAIVWLPASPRPFDAAGRAWISYAACFAGLAVIMTGLFDAQAGSPCGIL